MMVAATAGELRGNLSDYLDRAEHHHERITITRNGKASAVLISPEDAELLRALEDRIDLAEALEARVEAKREGYVPWRDVKAEAHR